MSVKTIPIAEFRELLDTGKALTILDVRTPGEFDRLHAKGAESMPLNDLNPAVVAAKARQTDNTVYVLCHSGTRAAMACSALHDAGLTHVYSIEGGTKAWESAGLPVIRGTSRVISLERQVRIGAGSIVLLGLLLAWLVHPLFTLVAAFIGAGLVFAGVTDICGMAILLGKMPWNRRKHSVATTCSPVIAK
jgi:rhodanese-related sulfurtransferase